MSQLMKYQVTSILTLCLIPVCVHAMNVMELDKKLGITTMTDVYATNYDDVPKGGSANDPSIDPTKVRMDHQEISLIDKDGKTYWVLAPLRTGEQAFGKLPSVQLIKTKKGKAFLCVESKKCLLLKEVNSQ